MNDLKQFSQQGRDGSECISYVPHWLTVVASTNILLSLPVDSFEILYYEVHCQRLLK